MDHISLKTLLEKYNEGNCSDDEKQLLESWYLFEANEKGVPVSVEHLTAANSDIWNGILRDTGQRRAKASTYPIWSRVIAIAAAVSTVVFGIYFYNALGTKDVDIEPGKNIATITMANGSTIVLSDKKTGVVIGDKLKYNDNTDVVRSGDKKDGLSDQVNSGSFSDDKDLNNLSSDILTAKTPRGGTYQVVLSDGTRVWLNAASTLAFPAKFVGANRTVTLNGEGYFEVSKDKSRPFIVKSGRQQVKVLGTHFNINSYDDEIVVKTTLFEGSVIVNEHTTLKPGEQSIWDGTTLKVGETDLEAELSWKNGDFIFNGETLESVMRKVSRWYDVEVIYAVGAPKNFTLGGFVSRSKPITAVLAPMEKTGKVKFKVNGRKITVMP